MRITAATVIEYIDGGDSDAEILGLFPDLELEDLVAVRRLYARRRVTEEPLSA